MKSTCLFAKIFITGGIVLGLELASSRILTPFFGVSLYVWSGILSVTLIALALGYRFGGAVAARLPRDKALLLFAASGALAALWLDLCLWTYPYLFWPLADGNLVAGSIAACLYLLFVPLAVLSALNPMLVFLLADERSAGDRGAGNVFFVSTLGSVLGVFAVAYGLLPHLTNYETVGVLTLISAALSLAALAVLRDFSSRLFRIFSGLALAAFIITALTLLSGGLERFAHDVKFHGVTWHVVHAEPTSFGHLQVVDLENDRNEVYTRILLNDGMMQNAFSSSGRSTTLYTYALEKLALAAAPDARKALVLGIGGGVLPMAFSADDMDVRAVDINRDMVNIAQRYLGFEPGRIQVEIQDARTAARHCSRDNDIVAVDLFREDGIPEHLVTREFFNDIMNCMNDKGAMVMNSFIKIGNPEAQNALLQTIASVFGEVYVVRQPPEPGSDFTADYIVARKGGPVGTMDISRSNLPAGLSGSFLKTIESAAVIRPGDAVLSGAPVLSDVSNQWKHLAWPMELAFRRTTVAIMPWQILMN